MKKIYVIALLVLNYTALIISSDNNKLLVYTIPSLDKLPVDEDAARLVRLANLVKQYRCYEREEKTVRLINLLRQANINY